MALVFIPLTGNEMMERGLRVLGVGMVAQARRLATTNEQDFESQFGSRPSVIANLWNRLHTTANSTLHPSRHFPSDFLVALHWLRVYPTEKERKLALHISEKTARKWTWYYAKKIAALKTELIQWPADWGDRIFTVTVDGVHFRIQEPPHPTYKRDKQYFSHKFGRAGLDYEIAISIFESKGVWVNGPFKAGRHDVKIFKDDGLKDLIPQGKRVVADRGYRGAPEVVSYRNDLDTEEVKEFKRRALSRHEGFNSRLDTFKSLQDLFRHSHEKHAIAFDAVIVICQLELLLNASPLFDV
jgi:hypothetical protein